MTKKNEGICRICGKSGPLSFEHVPPHSAFNDRPVIAIPGDRAIRLGPGERGYGQIQQRGAGGYTLCGKCNNDTGDWYAKHFARWCYQGMDVLVRSGGRPKLVYLHYIYPLRIIKQIVTMMFSVNNEHFHERHPTLVKFVLDREARYLPPKYRFFVYYTVQGTNRALGTSGLLNVETGRSSIFSEISFPPFGYVMTLDSQPPDHRLLEITHFSRYDYHEMIVAPLHLPVLPTHMGFPGDYRTLAEIDRDYAINMAYENAMLIQPSSPSGSAA